MNSNATGEQLGRNTKTSRGVTRWLIREVLGVFFVVASLFIPAGRLDWVMGWALVGIYAIWTGANALILIPRNPELLAERASRRKGAKTWDTLILSIIGLSTLAKHVLAGLDVRFGWTGRISMSLQFAALIIVALGYALGTWAMATNAFFSLVNRIQGERGHTVATSGPYRYVRHPAYTGMLAFELTTPIMLGSLWAFIPGILNALLIIVRAALEDKTLHSELPGYTEYARQTRYRLLPGVW
jgi:protein-S-isoprenylcysteine O-methyltransferase Ste14